MAGRQTKTLMDRVRGGVISPIIKAVAKEENMAPELMAQGIAKGLMVIPQNRLRKLPQPRGMGVGLRTKVNANIGTSPDYPRLDDEIKKLHAALDAGADAVMDLSTGGDLVKIREKILELCPRPLGTVPIYQAIRELLNHKKKVPDLKVDDIFRVIEDQAAQGVDFMTVHCGIRLETIRAMRGQRVADIVSRGGAFLAAWMNYHDRENPLYEYFDRLVEIARRYDVTLSLGDGLRPGAIFDATDRAQISELGTLGELTEYAWSLGVQVMIEGPGHVPLDQIETNVKLQKRLCKGAPFYVLGPVVTDIAPGYDHITSAIGGAIAAAAGADFLCYVTPSEHLGLPDAAAVREGVITARIAAHAADIVKGIPGAAEWDLAMSKARKALDWDAMKKLALDPEKFAVRDRRKPKDKELCSMCGEFCAMKVATEFL